jgi:NAD(P)H-flavin reductase
LRCWNTLYLNFFVIDFSPITRPDDEGVIGILCRNDDKGGHVTKLIRKLRPGSVMHMCPMGGLRLKFDDDKVWFRGAQIHRINLIAGGTGIAPMIQVIRAFSRHVRNNGGNISGGLNLIYAAEDESDLAFMKLLNRVHDDFPRHFKFYVKLNSPPLVGQRELVTLMLEILGNISLIHRGMAI